MHDHPTHPASVGGKPWGMFGRVGRGRGVDSKKNPTRPIATRCVDALPHEAFTHTVKLACYRYYGR